ncbi:hypothetical protein Leryth_025906 [Lithospermum erythrorhizon]|nr:hypothetical protein Leryth_025906 [Lithospermum erythrorhizon]
MRNDKVKRSSAQLKNHGAISNTRSSCPNCFWEIALVNWIHYCHCEILSAVMLHYMILCWSFRFSKRNG